MRRLHTERRKRNVGRKCREKSSEKSDASHPTVFGLWTGARRSPFTRIRTNLGGRCSSFWLWFPIGNKISAVCPIWRLFRLSRSVTRFGCTVYIAHTHTRCREDGNCQSADDTVEIKCLSAFLLGFCIGFLHWTSALDFYIGVKTQPVC